MGLSFREKLGASVKKGGLSNNELHHPSRAYERHFEGYVEQAHSVPGQKRSRSVRTYVDSFWVADLSGRARLWLRIAYVALFLISLPPFLYSATRITQANLSKWVAFPQAVSLFALGWTAVCLYRYCTAPQNMTVRQHRLGVKHLHISTCIAWAALAVLAAAYLVFALISPAGQSMSALCALLCLISCLCMLAVFLVERRVVYTELDNPLARETQ